MNEKQMWKYLQYLALCDLKTKEYKVILYLMKKLVKKDEIKIKQSELAEDLEISKSDVSKALNNLSELELINFNWLSSRSKTISLVEYDEEELDEMISEIINFRSMF